MPKAKRIKNILKSIAGSSSPIAPSLDASEHHHSTRQESSSQGTSTQPPSDFEHTTAAASQTPSHVGPTPASQLGHTTAPSNQVPPQSSQPQAPSSSSIRRVGRHSNHYWLVDVIDQDGVTKQVKLKVNDAFNLSNQIRVVVHFDEYFSPIGEAAGLLAGVCGQLAIDSVAFPISFTSWSQMPSVFIDNCFADVIKPRFCFNADDNIAKRYINLSISKKWREYRIKLWNEFYDPTLSRNALINNVPSSIPIEQWASFVDYRLKPETQEMCKRNKDIRKKQTIPHTCGAKSLARRRDDLKFETGRNVTRDLMWSVTHKRKDGSYVSDGAREIGDKIQEHISQSSENSSEISPSDAVGVVLGREHPGRVRGLGMGVTPSAAFKHTTTRLGGINLSSNTTSTSSSNMEEKMVAMESTLQAVCAYIRTKEGGRIPEEFAGVFPCPASESPADAGSGVGETNGDSVRPADPH